MSTRYPMIAWQVTYSAAVSWSASIARVGNTPIAISGTIPAATYWGQNASAVQGSDTPHGALVASIDAALATLGFGAATVTGTWDDGAYPWPRVSITIGGVANALNWTLTIGNLGARLRLGYLSSPVASVGMTVSTTCNHDGVWAPMVPWSDVDRRQGYIATQTLSPFSPANATIVNLGAYRERVAQWRYVPTRYVTRAWAAQATFADASGNSVLDAYNTVEGLLDAAVAGAAMRLYYDATGFDTVRLVWDTDPSTARLAEASQASGRRCTVTVPLVVTA